MRIWRFTIATAKSRAEWEPTAFIDSELDNVLLVPFFDRLDQPTFGLEISWNEPSKPWKPFITLSIWRARVYFGFLFDYK